MTQKDHPDSLFLAALVSGCKPSASVLHQLLFATGSAQTLWDQWSPQLLRQTLSARSAEALIAKGQDWRCEKQLDQTRTVLDRLAIQILTLSDFPEALRHSPDPPACLFVRGNPSCLHGRLLGIVGSRQATSYSKQLLPTVMHGLYPAHPTIVSGLAAGVDYLAHQAALACSFPTIAIFGTGIDTIYPKLHRPLVEYIIEAGGACISEYPPGFPGSRYTFPNRNRIIAGLCAGVLLSECAIKSGAMITARLALEAGREVFALPGSLLNPMSAGPNQLIAQGATPVHAAEDILQALGWTDGVAILQQAEQVPLPPPVEVSTPLEMPVIAEELLPVWQLLEKGETVSLSELQHQLQCSGEQLSTWLTYLELDGHIRQLPGQSVIRVD